MSYAKFLDEMTEEGFVPINLDTLLAMSQDDLKRSKSLVVYHDQDSWHADSFKALDIERERGIESIWMLHVKTDMRYVDNRHDCNRQIELMLAMNVTIGWHENILQHREPATPELVEHEIDYHLQLFESAYGQFPRIFSGHGDRKRMDECKDYARTPWIMQACERRMIPCMDFIRKDGTYTSDVGANLKPWRVRYAENNYGPLFINLHSGNYDVDDVFKGYYERGGL